MTGILILQSASHYVKYKRPGCHVYALIVVQIYRDDFSRDILVELRKIDL